jgi:3D (Asp-Asp-Asp) domain-containing protein
MCTFLNNKDEDSNKRRPFYYRIFESLRKIRDFQGLSTFFEIKNRVFGKKISLNLLSQLIWIIVLLVGIYPYHIEAEAENALNLQNSVNILIQNQNNTSFSLIPQKFNSSLPFAFNFGDYNSLNSLKLDLSKNLAQNENYIKKYLWVTAYSSSPDETDDDPFITATGKFVRDGFAATNILPFGTKIKIPSLFGDKIFTIEDRMHYRKTNVVDIWMDSKEKALKFGARYVEIIIFKDEPEFAQK